MVIIYHYIQHPQLSELAGLVVLHCRDNLALHLCTVNGRLLQSVEAVEKLEALLISGDARFLLTGGSKGSVTLRWLHSLEVIERDTFCTRYSRGCMDSQVVLRYEAGSSHIVSLAMSPEECFVAGLQSGALVLFGPDPRRKITARLRIST